MYAKTQADFLKACTKFNHARDSALTLLAKNPVLSTIHPDLTETLLTSRLIKPLRSNKNTQGEVSHDESLFEDLSAIAENLKNTRHSRAANALYAALIIDFHADAIPNPDTMEAPEDVVYWFEHKHMMPKGE